MFCVNRCFKHLPWSFWVPLNSLNHFLWRGFGFATSAGRHKADTCQVLTLPFDPSHAKVTHELVTANGVHFLKGLPDHILFAPCLSCCPFQIFLRLRDFHAFLEGS